jgi:HlyD family secretion protein
MDIPRKSEARKRRIRQAILVVLVIVLVAVGFGFLNKLKPAPPDVEAATVWRDVVKQGDINRNVRGLGTLVPEEIRWIPSVTDGRVEKRLVLPGTPVKADTVIVELSNPDLQLALVDAERSLKAAEADLRNLQVRLEQDLLDKQATSAQAKGNYAVAKAQADLDANKLKVGLITTYELNGSQTRADNLGIQYELEQKRLAMQPESARTQMDAQQTKVEQMRAVYDLKRSQVEALKVRAGCNGVLQQLETAAQVGQRVGPGTNLARVVDPTRLKATINIAETQIKDVVIGQDATIDTRNGNEGVIPGRVIRIDPSAVQGQVGVDVVLLAPLPKGARPDLSVEGTIELERMKNVVYVGRPAFGQEKSTIMLFRVEPGGKTAIRVPVKIGRMSVSAVEILEGLKPGDEVILSDMQRYDTFDRVRLQ